MSPLTPPIQPQPQVKEWIELFDKGVISREELRHQLALATSLRIWRNVPTRNGLWAGMVRCCC